MLHDEAEFRANAIAARYLRRWRKAAGMNVAEVAHRLGTSVAHIESYEDGSVEIDVAELMVLARFYGADIGELLREVDDMLGTRQRVDPACGQASKVTATVSNEKGTLWKPNDWVPLYIGTWSLFVA